MTPKFCGPKFKNGEDMAMGQKPENPPLLKKRQFFCSKNTSDLIEENICVQKDCFREKKLGVGLIPPQKNF